MKKVFTSPPSSTRIVVDTRPAEDLELGLIPNAYSIQYTTLLDTSSPKYNTFLAPEAFKSRLIEVLGAEQTREVLEGRRKVASTCLVGITASMLWVSLQNIGVQGQVYDEVSCLCLSEGRETYAGKCSHGLVMR